MAKSKPPEETSKTRPTARRSGPSRAKVAKSVTADPVTEPAPTDEPGGTSAKVDSDETKAVTSPQRSRKPNTTSNRPNAGKKPARNKPASPAKTAKKGQKKGAAPDLTVAQLADAYLKHLKEVGKSEATQFSYNFDLRTAQRVVGSETRIADLTPEKVAAYYESPEVTMRKNGKPRSKITIDKCRRVLRLALTWAAKEGLIVEAPLPDSPRS